MNEVKQIQKDSVFFKYIKPKCLSKFDIFIENGRNRQMTQEDNYVGVYRPLHFC